MSGVDEVIETKVVILGPTFVGKTSMVNQYVSNQFSANPPATIGGTFLRFSRAPFAFPSRRIH